MALWKQLLVLILLAAAGLGLHSAYRTYLAPQPQEAASPAGPGAVPVETARAEHRVLQRTVEAVGTTRARRSIEIVPEADGRLVELRIEPGARVAQGDVLARLDDTIERADLAEAEAVLAQQERTLDRVRQLRETNAVSQATLEEATARLAEAVAARDRALRRLEEREITAPFGGILGLTNYHVGARVTEGEVLTRLDDLAEVEVEFGLPETIFALVAQGQRITAHSAAFPGRAFTGTIAAVDSRIDAVSRAFRVRALIPNPDSTLPAGMFLSLTLVLSEEERLVVPEEAIVFQAAETYVFVDAGGVAERRIVATGQRKDGLIAILSGLEPGEEVVIRGLQRVRDATPITVLNQKQGTAAESAIRAPEAPT